MVEQNPTTSHLRIQTPVRYSSEIPTEGQGTERLVELCQAVGGTTYLSGAYAVRAYLEAVGLRLRLEMVRPGFYPRGGGEVRAVLQPSAEVAPLRLLGQRHLCVGEDIVEQVARRGHDQ